MWRLEHSCCCETRECPELYSRYPNGKEELSSFVRYRKIEDDDGHGTTHTGGRAGRRNSKSTLRFQKVSEAKNKVKKRKEVKKR